MEGTKESQGKTHSSSDYHCNVARQRDSFRYCGD